MAYKLEDVQEGWWGACCCPLDLQRLDAEEVADIHEDIKDARSTWWYVWPTLEEAVADFRSNYGPPTGYGSFFFCSKEEADAWAERRLASNDPGVVL